MLHLQPTVEFGSTLLVARQLSAAILVSKVELPSHVVRVLVVEVKLRGKGPELHGAGHVLLLHVGVVVERLQSGAGLCANREQPSQYEN